MCRFDIIMEENMEVAFRPLPCGSRLWLPAHARCFFFFYGNTSDSRKPRRPLVDLPGPHSSLSLLTGWWRRPDWCWGYLLVTGKTTCCYVWVKRRLCSCCWDISDTCSAVRSGNSNTTERGYEGSCCRTFVSLGSALSMFRLFFSLAAFLLQKP